VHEAKRGSLVRKMALTTLRLIFERANSDFRSEMIQHLALQCLQRNLQLELDPFPSGTSADALAAKIRNLPAQERLLLMSEICGESSLSSALGECGFRF